MTREELKQEAEEYATKRASKFYTRNMWDRYYQTYIDSAEPREKHIAELEHQLIHRNCLDCSNHSSKLRMRNLELEKENAELTEQNTSLLTSVENLNKSVQELEMLVQKLKCCENCKHHCFWGDELKCRTLSYDEELECMKTKIHWELEER